MDLRFLIIVYGLLLTASGLENETNVYLDVDLPDYPYYATQRNAAIALHRLLAESITHGNIALSSAEVFMGLTALDAAFGDESELGSFLDPFRIDSNRTATAEQYRAMMYPFDMETTDQITFKSHFVARNSCVTPYDVNRMNNRPNNGYAFKSHFLNIKGAVITMKKWYRRRNVHLKLETRDFKGGECLILFGGGYFKHFWQTSDRCVLRSAFFMTDKLYKAGIVYTRVISDFPGYGSLPELNAKYVEVPWNVDDVNIGLYVILPDAADGLQELQMKITGDTIRKMVNEATGRRVVVTLPELKLTRKYHMLPIIKNDSTPVVRDQYAELINSVSMSVFHAPENEDCSTLKEFECRASADLPQFNADHPFLIAIVYKGDGTGNDAFILGMVTHRVPEQRKQ